MLKIQIKTVLAACDEGLRDLIIDEILAQLPPAAFNLDQVNHATIMVSEVAY